MTGWVAAWRASYTAGDWLVLAGPTSLVALDPQTTLAGVEIEAIWKDIVASSSMDDLIMRLGPVDRSVAPRLLVLFWTADGLRTLVRGDLTLREVRTGNAVAQGDGVITWREVGLGDVTSAVVALPGSGSAGGQALPLVVGAVRAGSLRVDADPHAVVRSPQAATGSELSEYAQHDHDPEAAAGVGDEPTRRVDDDTDPAAAATPPDSPPEANGDEETLGTDVSDEAGLRGDRELENADTALMDPALIAGPVGGAPSAPTAVVPGAPGRPMVAAVSCPNGHLNPPYANGCWICGESIGAREPESVPRPVLARLRLPDGSSFVLDRPALIGRAPAESDGLPLNGESPQLLTVPSPGHDISRTHLLIAPDGWQILVTDLRSTNGTTVVAPGPGVERIDLQPMQPLSVAIGTLVELGDGIALLIDGAE